ncbi:hypothetical protein ACRPK8_01600 [Exiguobacterium sp. TDN 0502]|uniref:hypothetical protein n=1 Tax=Exiguobacterium sp. TDN 0502 TaxID=3420731 RepID=UPI003D787715
MSYTTFYTFILIALGVVFIYYIEALDVLERWQFFLLYMVFFMGVPELGKRLFGRYQEKRFHPQTAIFLIILIFAGMLLLGNIVEPN